MSCLGRPMPGMKDPKGPRAALRTYQSNYFSNFYNSLFFRNRKTKNARRSVGAYKTWEQIL